METTVNGHRLNVECAGPDDGPPVILMHHGLGAIQSWEEQIPALAAAGYRVIAYDRWGYGGSASRQALSMPYFGEDLADLEALLDLLEIPQATLIGHSDGGTIALYFAAQQPQRVTALVLVAAHIYVEARMGAGINETRAAFEQKERFRRGMERVHGDKGEGVFWNWYHGWTDEANLGWNIQPLLAGIPSPALVVQGLEDEHKTPQHAGDIAGALPQATLWLEPEVGHMLPQDKPEVFNRRVIDFLKQFEVTGLRQTIGGGDV